MKADSILLERERAAAAPVAGINLSVSSLIITAAVKPPTHPPSAEGASHAHELANKVLHARYITDGVTEETMSHVRDEVCDRDNLLSVFPSMAIRQSRPSSSLITFTEEAVVSGGGKMMKKKRTGRRK